MKRKFVVVDPGLKRLGGHNFAIAMAFADAAQALGYETICFCHKSFPLGLVPDHLRAENVFSLSYYSKFEFRWYWVRLLNRLVDRAGKGLSPPPSWRLWLTQRIFPFASELASALRRHGVGPGDHVFVTTAEYLQFEALLQLFRTQPRESLPIFHVRTCFDETFDLNRRFGARLPLVFERLAGLGAVGVQLFFYAEIPQLAAHFAEWGVLPFEVLENPVPIDLAPLESDSAGEPADSPLKILVPGQARIEKGYLRLPGIVAALCARSDVSRPFQFVLQSNLRKSGGDGVVRRKDRDRQAAKQALMSFADGKVRLVDRPMTGDEYFALMAEASIVLLPYELERYRNRPSMIASEAAWFGKPLVATRGTTLAAYAGPGLGETASTDEEFAERLARILNDYESYREKSMKRATMLRQTLDCRNLVRRMVDRAEASGESARAGRSAVL